MTSARVLLEFDGPPAFARAVDEERDGALRWMARLLDYNNGLCAFRAMPRHVLHSKHDFGPWRNFEEG